jgi:hypothetical protein
VFVITPATQPTSEQDDDDVRRCARGDWCATRTSIAAPDGTHRPQAAPVYRAFCDADVAIIDDSLRLLPRFYPLLIATLGIHRTTEVSVRVPFGPSVPLQLDVDMLMRTMAEAVRGWHERVATPAGLAPPDTQRTRWENLTLNPAALNHPVRVLSANNVGPLLALGLEPMLRPAAWKINGNNANGDSLPGPEVVLSTGDLQHVMLNGSHAGREILRLDHMSRSVLGLLDPKPVKLFGVPCKSCLHRTLDRAAPPQHSKDPEYWSQCRGCRHRMKHPEYKAWVKLNAAFAKRQVTVPVLGAAPAT